jgi:hypothetical protein
MLRLIVYSIWVHRSTSDAFNAFKLQEDCNFITEYWSLSSHVGRPMFWNDVFDSSGYLGQATERKPRGQKRIGYELPAYDTARSLLGSSNKIN